ncbi:hypothetical protein C3E87_05345 [Tessaracoccus sp. ZS01]|nr:hypothetical protein [Tessaracoccus sp. ZS01]OMG57461.1 hypothetical protein BJN44_05360 [Tessaracoccus sp. ZS01]
MTLVAFLIIGGIAVGLSLLTPARVPASATIDLPRTTRMTCLQSGDALAYSAGTMTAAATESGDEVFSGTGSGLFAEVDGPFVIGADALAVAGIYAAGPARTFAPCAPAATSGTIVVTEPGDAELLITNSDANEAIVDLTLLGPDGEVAAIGARGIAVAPGVSRRIALSVLSPEGPVGVSFRASEGRVAMAAVNVEGRAARYVAPTRPALEHLIGGVPPGASAVQLVISNPREERADITVTALGATSSYELAATADLSVEPMSSVVVPIADSLGGEASAIRVESTQEVAAGVVVSGPTGSPATLVDVEAAPELAATTMGGALQITNPGTNPVEVKVSAGDELELTVSPGTTVVQVLPLAAQQLVTLTADGPVIASAATSEATGTIIVPLGGVVDEPRSAGTAELDAHLR